MTTADAPRVGALDARVVLRHAALDATLHVDAGECVAVMGPSGAGKTSLLSAIAGLVRLDDGHIDLDGVRLSGGSRHVPPSRRGIGLLGQDALLFPHLTAADNIAFAARAAGLGRMAAREASVQWMERVGLAGRGTRRTDELSGGQRQRVALARALAARPRLLLLDEPFTSLDVEAAAQLRDVVREQRGATRTVLVSHGVLDAQALASRLVILQDGGVMQEGTVAAVLADPATSFVAAVAAAR